ncbi:hypothetical protein [Clostridium psychrophilum]|uniref:hypothetical protein n=1 Tax=Clostridium psychrophilum TaxID=132926 RepID=UPI001C0C6691|nr:hypothetical protein [Clostridium psychrophilum]MBU3180654.1 hypothetical protein [Clostridium psychrophilum]
MDNYIEVIYNILQLLSTIEDGLCHIKRQLSELRYEEALGLLQDSMIGIMSIENVIEPMIPQLKENNIEIIGVTLKENIGNFIAIYEVKREVYLERQMEERILPVFRKWKQELERVLRPYVVS